MNFYRQHIGDYARDTAHLDLLEHGVYRRLIDLYYTNEGPIADADAARKVGARTDAEIAAVRRILDEFFTLANGCWSQVRCEREIAEYRDLVARNQANGKAGGRPLGSRSKPNGNPVGSQSVASGIPVETESQPTGNPPSSQKPVAITQYPEKDIAARSSESDDKPAARLSPTWMPNESDIGFIGTQRPDLNVEDTIEAFRDYYLHDAKGKKTTRANWSLSWKRWVRQERQATQIRSASGSKLVTVNGHEVTQNVADSAKGIAAFVEKRRREAETDITPKQEELPHD